MQKILVWFLGGEDPLEKRTATHFSILPWRIPWMEKLGSPFSPWIHKESYMIEWLSTAQDSTNIKIKYMWMFHILDKRTSTRSKQKVQTVGVQSYPTLCDPLNYSPRGSSVHGVFQVRTWKEFIISYSRRSSLTRDWKRTHVSCDSCIGRWVIYHCTTWEYSFKSNLQSLWWFKHENI